MIWITTDLAGNNTHDVRLGWSHQQVVQSHCPEKSVGSRKASISLPRKWLQLCLLASKAAITHDALQCITAPTSSYPVPLNGEREPCA